MKKRICNFPSPFYLMFGLACRREDRWWVQLSLAHGWSPRAGKDDKWDQQGQYLWHPDPSFMSIFRLLITQHDEYDVEKTPFDIKCFRNRWSSKRKRKEGEEREPRQMVCEVATAQSGRALFSTAFCSGLPERIGAKVQYKLQMVREVPSTQLNRPFLPRTSDLDLKVLRPEWREWHSRATGVSRVMY